MLELNIWSVIWTVVNLLVLFLIVRRFLVKPVMGVIQKREEMIRHQFETASATQKKAEEMRVQYQDKLKSSQEQAEEIFTTAKSRANEERERILADTKTEADRMMEKAKIEIANEQKKAEQEVQAEIAKLAMLAARKIMKTGEVHDTGSKE